MYTQQLVESHKSKSGQLGFSIYQNPCYLSGFFKDLSNVTTGEYLEFVSKVGDAMHALNTGRFILDISEMKGFSLSLRAAAVNNIKMTVIDKAPYFILAIVKGNDLFENLATQTALKMALPLSSKFLAGKMFDCTEEARALAVNWLLEFQIPSELKTT